VYALIVSKSGSRLRVSTSTSSPKVGVRPIPGGVQFFGEKATIGSLVYTLGGLLDRPVVDHTGLTGEFDFRVSWAPAVGEPGPAPGQRMQPERSKLDEPPDSLFEALPTQLGLRLEATKGPVDLLIIDHAVRPSAN
jgi:uncharacterized protein (TIGR03435 family)